jgi:effector-binding domain-containing protein
MSFIEAEGMGHSAPEKVGIFCRHTAQPVLSLRLRLSHEDFVSGVREALAELRRVLTRTPRDEQTREIPFIAYHALSADSVTVEVGIPLGKSSAGARGEGVTSIPMGRYVSVDGSLAQDGVAQAYRELAGWLAQNKEHCTGPTYTTLAPSSAANSDDFLVQRRICAGPELGLDACAGMALLSPEASELAEQGLELLRHERAYN